ncbi:MAG: hypothetical protein QM820_07405 [Minicystis sp.]
MGNTACFVITAHGYGHASRQMEVIRTLLGRRPELTAAVLSAAPEAVFRDYLSGDPALSARVAVVPYRPDVGLVQRDGLTMDHEATLSALASAFGDPDRAEGALAAALSAHDPAIVVADIPAVAFGAARRISVPSVAVGNFDWAWIYAYYAERYPAFASYERLCRAWQSLATTAVHLPPGPPLTGFRDVVEAAPLARRLLVDPLAVRARLQIPPGDRAVLVSFGGFGLDDPHRRIPPIPGVTWILAPPMEDLRRPDTRFVPHEPYLALLAACDAVFTKPGYGIVCEATRNRTRLLYTDRGDFPEYPWLVRWLDENAPAVHVPAAELGTARGADVIRAGLDALFALPDRWPDRWDGAERAADVIERLLVRG